MAKAKKRGKATHYTRGKSFEYRPRDDLREKLYFVVQAGGSKGIADLVAVKKGVVLFVQAKTNGKLGFKEWNAVYDAAMEFGAVPIFVSRLGKSTNWKLVYYRLLAPKVFRSRIWPMEPFEP